jgi:two-component system response regulator HydG
MSGRILVVDDDEATCDLIESALARQGFRVTTQTSAREAISLVASQDFDVVLTDLGMTEMGGIEFTERVLGVKPDMPVIVVTGHGSLETAISAMRAGAFDFVTKPVDGSLLGLAVTRAVRHKSLGEEVKRLRAAGNNGESTRGIIGRSAAMKRTFELINRVAPSDASVLVHGETGTGKELVARAIHEASGRTGPFVAINCAAVPPTLLESELFGHARGAFTDAKAQRTGLFLEAANGTLFLDEIAEMPLEVQPKLLRALQERKVRPVGSNAELPFNSRLVCATNRDLETEAYEKRFREDLYYRINVVKIDLPALRDRGTDVLDLAQYFLDKFSARSQKGSLSLSTAAAEKLTSYNWPGNVRELENCIERAVALARFDHVTVQDLPEKVQAYRADRFVVAVDEAAEILTMDELERRYIVRVLSLVGGNKSRAAQLLGFDRRTLYRKLERYEAHAKALTNGQPVSVTPSTPSA